MGFHSGGTLLNLPYSAACDNNRDPILEALRGHFADCRRVLEIGSGTGQHAVYFARRLPHLFWQTSDLPLQHAGIVGWLAAEGLANVGAPLNLDVRRAHWPGGAFDGVFTANSLHIMGWPAVEALFRGVRRQLLAGGVLCIYGPFNYGGQYTSASNARFDQWLRERDPASGVRDFEAVDALAVAAGLVLQADRAMPANNRLLCWRRLQPASAAS